MRVLQLSKWLSMRADNGGKARSFGLASALARFAEVDVIGVSDIDHGDLAAAHPLRHYRRLYPVPPERGVRRAARVYSDALRGFALRSCRFRSAAYRRRIAEVLQRERYDVIQVEEISTMQNLEPWPSTPVVYSAHNIESALSPQLLGYRGVGWRLLAPLEARRATAEERRALERAQACLTVSAEDKRSLESLGGARACPIHVVPNCVGDEVVAGAPQMLDGRGVPQVVNVGCFGWAPNDQGAHWFLARILPALERNAVRCRVRFVGSEIDARLAAAIRAQECECDADVADTLPYLHDARAAIVPLQIGGGTRLKIVEAWAAGVPVVSTPLGAEGLGCTDGVDALLAADAESFAHALRRVLEDDALYLRLRANGLQRAATLRWNGWANALEAIYAPLTSAGMRG